MSLASDFAALITAKNADLASTEALRPAPFVGPVVTISVTNEGDCQLAFGTNLHIAPAAAAVAVANYLLATFA